jgi:F0F1-type ATP synthase delta subunit
MKTSPKNYARAFAEVVSGDLSAAEEKKFIKNFTALVEKNGDASKWSKILMEAERMIREKTGQRKIVLESARPLTAKLRKELNHIVRKDDVVEEKVDAALVAGVRVLINDEEQFDASLARKLQKMFA